MKTYFRIVNIKERDKTYLISSNNIKPVLLTRLVSLKY